MIYFNEFRPKFGHDPQETPVVHSQHPETCLTRVGRLIFTLRIEKDQNEKGHQKSDLTRLSCSVTEK